MRETISEPVPVVAAFLVALVTLGVAPAAAAANEWLAVCSKCISPTIFSKSGIGTAQAVAEARITRAEVEAWCANWQPGDRSCVKQQLAAEDLNKVYRATADCPAGRIMPIDGRSYSFAGVWDQSDIGGGRSRWRDASGKIVGRDNASGGLAISQQWEVLCPASARGAPASPAPATTAGAAANASQSSSKSEFAVGQVVLARYGSDWVRARVNRVQHSNGPGGPRIDYDVSLENGKRGVVPARMLRTP